MKTGQKKQIHKEKTSFCIQMKHKDLETLKKEIIEFADIRNTALEKGLGNNIHVLCTFLRTVKMDGNVSSFSLRSQQQWQHELPKLQDPFSILQGEL